MAGRVCLVSPGNLASNPRLLKEAEALHGAGYDVTAVVCSQADSLGTFDEELAAGVAWQVRRVVLSPWEKLITLASRSLARLIAGAGRRIPVSIAAAAYGGPAGVLKRAVQSVQADLYIAHYVVALPAAAAAAQRHDAMLGYDAEDFHAGEGTENADDVLRMKMVERIEGEFLPFCSHLTAASPLIAQAYAERYGVSPTTVLNVFPLQMAPPHPGPAAGRGSLKTYWFSQTIGLDRGLQGFLRGMAKARARISLDIRGSNRWRHGDELMVLARELGVADRVALLPMAPPEEMVKLASNYDLGLSLEEEVTRSRSLCLTNKIFTYLLAGVPVMMSDTPAQLALAPDLGVAATVVSLADSAGIADALDRLALLPAELAEAKALAWRLGRQRYNWDIERRQLLDAVGAAFARRNEERSCRL